MVVGTPKKPQENERKEGRTEAEAEEGFACVVSHVGGVGPSFGCVSMKSLFCRRHALPSAELRFFPP